MKILLAIDESKFSERATQAIIHQMRPEGTEVCVLHVVQLTLPVQSVREGRELVSRTERTLSKAGFKVSTAVKEGDPRIVVIDYAAEWKADLIVVGSHGRTGFERFLMGSVAESIARHSRCSVQIVRPDGPWESQSNTQSPQG
jgi:nucleotide-binding universal stress UspA family protein